MRKRALLCLLAACCVCIAACGREDQGTGEEAVSGTVYAMDTVMDFTIYGEETLADDVEEIIRSLEKKFSITDTQSEVAALNRDKTAMVSDDTRELLEAALSLCEKTDGLLDISIYPLVKAWGFTTGEYRVPDEAELRELLAHVSWRDVELQGNTVTIGEEMELDLGSVAKGYTGDRILEALSASGVKSALLNLGGNVQTLGDKADGNPWKVAVSDPEGSGYIGAVSVTGKAVITSGGYERYFEEDGKRYHHILDPRTGHPAESGFQSVTIVGESGVMCDAYSTALYVMGPEMAFEFWRAEQNFDAIFLTDDGTLYITEGLEEGFEALGRFASTGAVVLRY